MLQTGGANEFHRHQEAIKAAIAAERERCAAIAQRVGNRLKENCVGNGIADAIRKQG